MAAFRTDKGGTYTIREINAQERDHFTAAMDQGFSTEVPTHIATGNVGDIAVVIQVTGRVERRAPGGWNARRAAMHLIPVPGEQTDIVRGWVTS